MKTETFEEVDAWRATLGDQNLVLTNEEIEAGRQIEYPPQHIHRAWPAGEQDP